MTTKYIHGTEPDEQTRLERLNQWMNARCIAAMALRAGDRVVDFGSGLGSLSEEMAAIVGPSGCVVGIERDERQIAVARSRLAPTHAIRPTYRAGTAEDPPLEPQEWGSFDVAHARFVLEHVASPEHVVRNMVRSVRPGGRVILIDDDHALLRLWPDCPGFDAIWTAYQRGYDRNGNDPLVGRRLVQLLHRAGAKPVRNDWIFFGSCVGSPDWTAAVENLVGVIRSAEQHLIRCELIDADSFHAALQSLMTWMKRPDAALWFGMAWAEGCRSTA